MFQQLQANNNELFSKDTGHPKCETCSAGIFPYMLCIHPIKKSKEQLDRYYCHEHWPKQLLDTLKYYSGKRHSKPSRLNNIKTLTATFQWVWEVGTLEDIVETLVDYTSGGQIERHKDNKAHAHQSSCIESTPKIVTPSRKPRQSMSTDPQAKDYSTFSIIIIY